MITSTLNSVLSASDRTDRICKAAKTYQENLCDKRVLFVCGQVSKPHIAEAEFKSGNFAHLVGISSPHWDVKASDLYRKALIKQLTPTDYTFTKDDVYSDMKLEVAGRVFAIDVNGRMIGDLRDSCFVNLDADKVVGRANAVLGLIEVDDIYIPNSVINADIREVARDTTQVLATFKKPTGQEAYSTLRYVAQGVTVEQFEKITSILQEKNLVARQFDLGNGALAKRFGQGSNTHHVNDLANSPSPSPKADARRASASTAARKSTAAPHKGKAR